jgi:hypothetical protein
MRASIRHFNTLSDVVNAVIRVAAEDDWKDEDDLWSFLSSELKRMHAEHSRLADDADALEIRLRHRSIAQLCESLAHPDNDMQGELFESAKRCAERATTAEGEAKKLLLAQARFCLLMIDMRPEKIGMTRAELGYPEPAVVAA